MDRNWKKSRREEERIRERWDNGALAQRQNIRAQEQQLSQPQVWSKRQEQPQQQVLTVSVLMEEVKRTDVVIVCLNQQIVFVPQ